MELFLGIAFVAVICAFIYLIYRYFAGFKVTVTDELFSQNGVTVEYKAGTIKVRGKVHPVSKITRIRTNYNVNGSATTQHVLLDTTDIKNPVLMIIFLGREQRVDTFVQRLSIAIQQAGGGNFV
ncbi:hypothetical protein [Pedobacter sp. MC2016-24]|uniref:hypothetical protein n=1 Tax=Pedobacter sp. MC2016-24 TaxID=2780090 RepID=UPI001880AB0E|nr:hypothetical protein [Pedobacter sp. MC2016-24]MBE9602666.1 hypothetical protein [Pedobacter sp. MC2016-24]